MRKLSTEEFTKRAKNIHGDRYDYSLVEYINNHINVRIICNHHETIFRQQPNNHLNRQGCPKCAEDSGNNRRSNKEDFIEKSKKINGDRYDYSNIEYKNSMIKVKILCKEHGYFKQSPNNHLTGSICPKCARKNVGDKSRSNKTEINMITHLWSIKTIKLKLK